MSTWSGKTLGNVSIGNLIARGGMAEVYEGTHTTLNRKVAVKIMRDHVEEDPDSRSRFDREARVIASLSHPNIIQIFDYTLIDGRPCIVMELVSGASLANYLKELQRRGEKIPPKTLSSLLTSIASAVDYAHEHHIVHRDIKPANILLRSKSAQIDLQPPLPEDVEPVLTDFGLVRLLDSTTQTSTGTVSGTPSYMSPEQARGDKVDRKTDIYSLGVMLYEFIAGTVPFDAESSFGVLMKHLNEPPPAIPGISADMQAVINRALAKDPAHRFDSAGEMIREFIAVLNGQKVSEKTGKVSNLVTAPVKQAKSPMARLLIIASGIIILGFAIFAGIRWLRPNTVPAQDPNTSIGHIGFDDFNNIMDQVNLSTNGLLPLPEPGTHYEAWLLSQGGEKRLNIGVVAFDGNSGQVSYINPSGINLLSQFEQVELTQEPNDDPNPNEPSSKIVASSMFPPLAFVHVRHLLVSIGMTPNGEALIQGLWSAADSVDTSVQQLRDAFSEGDEAAVREKTEDIIVQLVGSENTKLYKDWNGDGKINDPVEGFGLLQNGDPSYGDEKGYIPQTISHAQFAADALDANDNVIEHSHELVTCLNNMNADAKQMLDLALKLKEMPFGSGMEATITQLEVLSSRMLYGEDTNGNGRIEPIPNEGRADTAYEVAYLMSEMTLLPGPNRVQLPAK